MTEEQANEIATRLTLAALAESRLFSVTHSRPKPADVGQELAELWRAIHAGVLDGKSPTLP